MAPVTEFVHLTARIPADLAEALTKLAEANERSASAEVRLALKAHIEANAQEPEEAAA
jgi:predicted transcriptional regulator